MPTTTLSASEVREPATLPMQHTFTDTNGPTRPNRRGTQAGSRVTYSRWIGGLFLAAFVVYGLGNGLVTSVLSPPDFLSTISTHQPTLLLGLLLMLLNLGV